MKKKLISIVSPSFNEEENIEELYRRINLVINNITDYEFEIIIIDNCSTDGTRQILRQLANQDARLKLIFNTRNFGHIRSPYWGMMQSQGVATICLSSDLQDPPEHIPQFIDEWKKGWKIVMMTKGTSHTNKVMHWIRRCYYRLLDCISDTPITRDATGFGLYDRAILEELRKTNDPYPFLRGLVCEFGYPIKTIEFNQPKRQQGISKNNFYTLYDLAMLGLISHSLIPIRLASFAGIMIAAVCFMVAICYLLFKIIFWDSFPLGLAPLVIGVFFLFGLLFTFIGLLGEYIGAIHVHIKNRPVVVEEERVNFD
jgi:glycosyltransferase involved in cell wall biosynthesis